MGESAKIDSLEARSAATAGVATFVVESSVMDAVVGFHLNRGILASADRVSGPSFEAVLAAANRLLVLEGVTDHENLGSLFRNAAAFGVDGVVLGPQCADPLYRRAVRVSMGNVLKVPFVDAPQWPQALYDLETAKFTTFAMTPYPPAVDLKGLPVNIDRVAILVGAEGPGLSAAALAAVRRHARIPMADGVDSLNVATAAALALSHFSPF